RRGGRHWWPWWCPPRVLTLRLFAPTVGSAWPASRSPKRSSSWTACPAAGQASCCGGSYADAVSTARQLNSVPPENQLTIEELAAESGMSVRNIRSHQARGLLPPPEVRMRVGYYGPQHVLQLRLIRELQDQGFNLNGIKRLLDDTHGTAERLLRVRQ